MTEYIEREAAKKAIMDYMADQTVSKYASSAECRAARSGAEGAFNEIDDLPAADVVEVVRCEKCKFADMLLDIIGDTHLFCAERDFREVGDDDFCSHGKRREV